MIFKRDFHSSHINYIRLMTMVMANGSRVKMAMGMTCGVCLPLPERSMNLILIFIDNPPYDFTTWKIYPIRENNTVVDSDGYNIDVDFIRDCYPHRKPQSLLIMEEL